MLVWYALAPACTQATPGCTGTEFVEVLNTSIPTDNKRAILIAAGPARAGQTRPAVDLSHLLDSDENSNALIQNRIFKQLPVDTVSNDQILIVAP